MEEINEAKEPSQGFLRKFVSGGVGGMCLVLTGHPLDTIKVRLQTMPLPFPGQPPFYTGVYNCLQKSYALNGIRGLYQGVGAPLLGSSPIYALCFMGYEFGKYIQKTNDEPLSYGEVAFAGAIGGLFTAPVMGPVDRVKCLLQIQDRPGALRFAGSRHCLKYLYRTQGLQSVYRGTLATVIMEMPSCAVYFATYEYLTRGTERKNLSFCKIIWAGGSAGVACWCVAFPFDVIKSRRQTAADGRFTGIIEVVREAVRTEGYKVFIKGLTPVVIRAFPANAACFVGYEFSEKLFDMFS